MVLGRADDGREAEVTAAATPPLTCSLEDSELTTRIRAWQQVAARATSRRVEGDRVVATYPDDPRVLEQLRGLVNAEATCCPFLEFSIERHSDAITTALRLPDSLPNGMKAMILDVLDVLDVLDSHD